MTCYKWRNGYTFVTNMIANQVSVIKVNVTVAKNRKFISAQ